MRATPPATTIALLDELGLATPAQVRRMGWRVRRTAHGLPQFESMWIDALASARILTPYQAAEIHAGRAAALRVGPWVLCQRLAWPPYAACYRAHKLGPSKPERLVVIEAADDTAESLHGQLARLAARGAAVDPQHAAAVLEVGRDGNRLWAAAAWTEGQSAAQWITHHGRFPPEIATEIARASLAALDSLAAAGICHGDISANNLILDKDGRVVLIDPGLRPIVRPAEGYAHADLPPEAYDYLAPERIAHGASADLAGDLYACGCLWWHLHCGRSPIAGGNTLAKLRAAHATPIADVCRLAPDTPPPMAAAIAACTAHDPARRPASPAAVVLLLGPTTPDGPRLVAQSLAECGRGKVKWPALWRAADRLGARASPTTVAAACLFVVACLGLVATLTRGHHRSAPNSIAATATASVPAAGFSGAKPPSPASTDPGVIAVEYLQVADNPGLDLSKPIDAATLRLKPGAKIAPKRGGRLEIRVGEKGLAVDVNDVRFDNCDFVAWAKDGKVAADALVVLGCSRAEFRRCTFRVQGGPCEGVAAVRWVGPAVDRSLLVLANGRLKLTDCVFEKIDTALNCRGAGATMIGLTNVLHLGGGPLVRWNHAPRADEPRRLALALTTLRGGGPLVECRYQDFEAPGELAIEADNCVFAPTAETPLVRFVGETPPGPILAEVRWTGQSSLMSTRTPFAAWTRADGSTELLDDSAVAVAGLVRGVVRFAGEPAGGPVASRAVDWQAPLLSTDTPGINPDTLVAPFSGPAHE